MKLKFIKYVALIAFALLSACGGGGSSTVSSTQQLVSIAYDSTAGKLIVTDFGLNIVQSVSALTGTASLTTLAGASGSSGVTNSTGTSATFNGLQGVATDSSGNLFVSELNNYDIRKIATPTATATVTTFAGVSGTHGSADGTGTSAYFYNPRGIAIDSTDNIYLADSTNQTIRKITSGGVVTTLAGYAGTTGVTNGIGSVARFNYPNSLAVDSAGTNLYVADTLNNAIRKIVIASQTASTLAGSIGTSNYGYTNATGTNALFYSPVGVATDDTGNGLGNVYVTDYSNNSIRKIVIATGLVTTLAGNTSGTSGYVNATGTAAYFSNPTGITYFNGNLYVIDQSGTHIRIVNTTSGAVTTLY